METPACQPRIVQQPMELFAEGSVVWRLALRTGKDEAGVGRRTAPAFAAPPLAGPLNNHGRPHIALDFVAPDPRPTPATGMIVRERKLFGLTTEYSRVA